MDALDREIEEAARAARQRVWRGRLATIASTATFFLVAIVGLIVAFTLFPQPDKSEFSAREQDRKVQREDPSVEAIADDYLAHQRDQGRIRWKVLPVVALAFGSAYLVLKHLKPQD
jgi:hypothetical protein